MKLCYAAYLYGEGNKKCDRLFAELRNSEIMSFKEKLKISPEINKITNLSISEVGVIVSVKAKNYFVKTERFDSDTICYLSVNSVQGVTKGNRLKYDLNFNYMGPTIIKTPRVLS